MHSKKWITHAFLQHITVHHFLHKYRVPHLHNACTTYLSSHERKPSPGHYTFNILYTYFFPIALHFQHLMYVFYLKRTTLSTSRSCTYFISSALPFHHLLHIFLLQGTTLSTSLARISSPGHYTFDISCTYFFSESLRCQHLLHVFYLECTTLLISHARISSDHFSLLHVIDCSLSI